MTLTRRSSLTIATGVVSAGVLGFLGWRRISPPPAPLPMHAAAAATPTQEGDQRRTERTLGDPAAKVTVQEFFSLTCSHCAAFHHATWPALKAKYVDTGKAKFILREFPLDPLAAAGSMGCVRKTGHPRYSREEHFSSARPAAARGMSLRTGDA